MMAGVTLRGIEKKLGGSPILRGIDLEIPDGSLVVLVGPTGCGKSTLLRTIAGLEAPDAGTVEIGGRDVMDFRRASVTSRWSSRATRSIRT